MFDLPEIITIWNIASNDGFGGKTYTRTNTPARIAYKQEKFTDKNGDTAISVAVCYTESDNINISSIVFFGDSVSVTPDDLANDVRALSSTPSGTNMKKAWF